MNNEIRASYNDVYLFPRSVEEWVPAENLIFEGTTPGKKGKLHRVYRCRRRDCPSRSKCTKNKQGRTINIGQHHLAMVRHREKQRNFENRWLLSRRKTIIELVFGIIKEVFGLRRWSVIGIEKV